DLVITRAGAGGLAEVAAVGKPAVVIPLASAAGGHQTANAKVFEDAGGAVVLTEDRLNGPELARTVNRLLHDPTRRVRIGRAARSLARLDAAAKVAELVRSAARQRKEGPDA
ncbi:MAG: glycosyltransferase, partial [Patescibacteria group bacterium]